MNLTIILLLIYLNNLILVAIYSKFLIVKFSLSLDSELNKKISTIYLLANIPCDLFLKMIIVSVSFPNYY